MNLQRHCYDLFHFDLPWNPNRLDQRNGRIDRKLQPADVIYCRYLTFKQRNEDRVLEVLMEKVERIRKELGSVTKILEERLTTEISREGISHDNIDEFISEIQKYLLSHSEEERSFFVQDFNCYLTSPRRN